jgi:hypothetical protein
MLDFITLSRREGVPQQLAQSIALMMGNVYKWNLIVVDGNKYDLFSGFNHGASLAKGEHLAFVHDDVQFLCNATVMTRPLQALDNPKVGFVGVAGSRVLPADGCWWGQNTSIEILNQCRGMVAHPAENEFNLHFNIWPPNMALFGQVLVLDGVFMMCHRRTFDKLGGFDEKHYKGFHFYDMDITFRAAQEKLVNLVAPIPLLHQTPGFAPDQWELGRQMFLQKFGDQLPARL